MYNRKSAYIVTPAAEKPVALSDLKQYLRIDGTDDDIMLDGFIAAATDQIETYLGRKLINTTIGYKLDGFSSFDDEALIKLGSGTHDGWRGMFTSQGAEIDLPYRPVYSVSSIVTYDKSNNASTVDAAYYRLDGIGGRIYLNSGYTWPTSLRDREAVLITIVCGYGDTADNVPSAIKQGIMMHAGTMYECRGGCDLSDACKAIVNGFRIIDRMGWM